MKFGAQTTTGSGKLTLTPELQLDREYPIEIELPNGSQGDLIKFEWKLPSFKFDPAFTREVEAAKHSDVVIAILGLTPPEERENMDRNTMNLPADQLALLKALLAVNPNIIVVFIAGSPLNLDWLNDNIPAILIAWYPGQRGGEAIANIISGDVTPSGKLPFAYFRHDSDVISMDEYDITKGLTYWYNSKIPLYPFGFGLSYTTFKYANFSLSKTELTLDPLDTFFVHGEIFNMGSYDGEEVVQVYIRKVSDLNHIPLKRPYPKMQLKGFTKILVSKGSSMRVEIRVLLENLTFFDASTGQLKCESGIYDVMVGRSSQQIEFTQQIEIHP
jgi:beta-glucosidase